MAELNKAPPTEEEGYFVVDAAYIRREARDGVRTFFAPLAGVYRAVTASRYSGNRKPKTKK